ncbi:MAG: FHA domain-containing protein [Planctomycetes bacterium]|jgi:pSer/pThr/pTyr-binding forkhead associated (FHA) protein|nr:FHA domain-containing protein [Planctomycetota bacterium]HPY74373.1 FHA domain-containing protein [Planctomycetota bacterium]HQA99967.1 FHA domain-containing protein [Planctomycetota bacterium]
MAKILIMNGVGKGIQYKIKGEMILGRLATNEIPLNDVRASRQNSRIYKQDDEYFIEDLQSRNGTILNGKNINIALLQDRDQIIIGSTWLLFRRKTKKEELETEDLTLPKLSDEEILEESGTFKKNKNISTDIVPVLTELELDQVKTEKISPDTRKQKDITKETSEWERAIQAATKNIKTKKDTKKNKDYLFSSSRKKERTFTSSWDAFFHGSFSHGQWYWGILKIALLCCLMIICTCVSRWITLGMTS